MISRYGIFCTVIENGSFTRAAEKLGYSQSAVSQAVKALETEIGATLLSRYKGNITLTDDGTQYYPYIRAIYQARDGRTEGS